jgi:REP element-mobilizing transposase RayT
VVDRRFIFHDAEKDRFVKLLREYEAFCSIEVLTFSILSNHFHLILAVPQRPAILPTMEEVLDKLDALTGFQNVGRVREELKALRQRHDQAGEAQLLARYLKRMWDLGAFMKLLKQRFSQWYNGCNKRKGTLWEERYRSLIIDGTGQALPAIAAYVDLNSVRAGLASDPKDYRWSGYGQAVNGDRKARLGLQKLVRALRQEQEESITKTLRSYRMYLFMEGDEARESIDENGRPVRGVLKHEEVLKVIRNKGRLELGNYVRCRVRYFTDGAVVGSKQFVESIFQAHRKRFGAKRRNGARRLKGLNPEEGLFTLRDLRLNVFG